MGRARSFLQQLRGYRICARDGQIGKIADTLFDDADWVVRYFVVDTGDWLLRREVLISPGACNRTDGEQGVLVADLTTAQVKDCPEVDLARPVSRQYQLEVDSFYGWPRRQPRASSRMTGPLGDPQLRSAHAVAGYRIEASDGEAGHIEDFLVAEETWTIEHIVVHLRNHLPARKVLVAPQGVSAITWSEQKVAIDKSIGEILSGAPYDPAAAVKRTYEG